jgi:hypothetical protein
MKEKSDDVHKRAVVDSTYIHTVNIMSDTMNQKKPNTTTAPAEARPAVDVKDDPAGLGVYRPMDRILEASEYGIIDIWRLCRNRTPPVASIENRNGLVV